jgi:hypothetical protein
MEGPSKRRLNVFRAITRDLSPGLPEATSAGLFETFPEVPDYSWSRFSLVEPTIPSLMEPEEGLFWPTRPFAARGSAQIASKLACPTLYTDERCLSPLDSLHMNVSTEDSSREEGDERGKPKKRPLEEGEKSFYVISLGRIKNAADSRTTVMIKNIPNKYTQKMLLQTIDKKFSGRYDFLYLPIDFKVRDKQNKCNVGYAFINFLDYRVIYSFFQEFNAKRWERFNSEKICALAYARIQGLYDLVHHFQNSSVINQDDNKVKPIILPKQ